MFSKSAAAAQPNSYKQIFVELLAKTLNRREIGVCTMTFDAKELKKSSDNLSESKRASSTHPKTLPASLKDTGPSRIAKGTIDIVDEKRKGVIIMANTHAMHACSAANSAVVMREKVLEKIKIYIAHLSKLNEIIATANKSTLAPLEFLKYFLQHRISLLILSSHLVTLDYAGPLPPSFAKPDPHQARAINAVLMQLQEKDPVVFYKTIDTIAELLAQKIMDSPLIEKTSIISRGEASAALDLCYDKIFMTLIDRAKYVLPTKTDDGKYLSYLTDNLCKGIVEVRQSAMQRFSALQHLSSEENDWQPVTQHDVRGYPAGKTVEIYKAPEKTPDRWCTIS